MIDHLGIQCVDVDASLAWYLTVFAPLGWSSPLRHDTPDGPVVALAAADGPPDFWLAPAPGAAPTRENHIAFSAGSRADVEAVHRAAVDLGAEVLHAPREWPEYHPGYYAVFLRDPDGHNVEAVCHR